MDIKEELINNLKLSGNSNIPDETYRKLLENTFSSLINNQEIHNINTLYNSKPDLIKSVYAALLRISAEFGRHNFDKEGVKTFLTSKCSYNSNKASLYADQYEKNKQELQIVLGKIGLHLPHITDVKWKIDYIIKSSNVDQADGPLFRICLVSHKYDETTGEPKVEHIKFSCNSQELQDLVYKLKDAVRHCQKLAVDH